MIKDKRAMKKLILASNSPRRKMILRKFKISFRVISPNADEEKIQKSLKGKNPYLVASTLAYEKAASVSWNWLDQIMSADERFHHQKCAHCGLDGKPE